MKKIVVFLICIVSVFAFFACDNGGTNKNVGKTVVLTPTDEYEGRVLADYMEHLKSIGELNYVMTGEGESGYISSLDGVEQSSADGLYWFLYTNDPLQEPTAFGSMEYRGETFWSPNKGVGTLEIVSGCKYLWIYKSWQS